MKVGLVRSIFGYKKTVTLLNPNGTLNRKVITNSMKTEKGVQKQMEVCYGDNDKKTLYFAKKDIEPNKIATTLKNEISFYSTKTKITTALKDDNGKISVSIE